MARDGAPQPVNGLDRAYRILSGDDGDERACAAIPDSACSDLPRNYLLNVLNGVFTKLAEQLASPGLVLPWLFAAAGLPALYAALLPPVKQLAGLAPQLAVAGWIRARPRRKTVWVAAGFLQTLLLAAIPLAVAILPVDIAGPAAILLFAGFCMASGAGSVAFQDVMGKTVPKGRRGRLLSNRATLGGMLTLVAAAAMLALGDIPSLIAISGLVLAAAGLWGLGAIAFAAIQEQAGATAGGRSMIRELSAGLVLLRGQPGYRRFLAARGALLSVELAMPFFALQAAAATGGSVSDLGVLVLAVGAAQALSSWFWGHWADRAGHVVMAASGALAALAGVAMLAVAATGLATRSWYFAPVFLLLGIAEAGARLGRKTYLADAAPANDRPLYVAVANTLTGLFAVLVGMLGVLSDLLGPAAGVMAISFMAGTAAVLGMRLPAAGQMVRDAGARGSSSMELGG